MDSVFEKMGNLGYGTGLTHPGDIIKNEIEKRGISQRTLAKCVSLSPSVLNEIINAHRPLTAKAALLFEAALGIPADSLIYLQAKYNIQTAREDKRINERLKKIKRITIAQ